MISVITTATRPDPHPPRGRNYMSMSHVSVIPHRLATVSTLCVSFLSCGTLSTLLSVSRELEAEMRPYWYRYLMWLDPYDADIVRRCHAVDDLQRDLRRLRSQIRRRREEKAQTLRAALRLLRQGVRCPNPACQRPIVRGTERCEFCKYWACSRCGGVRKPGTFGIPCEHCAFEDLWPCLTCRRGIPRDRERCFDCRRALVGPAASRE